MASVFKKYKAKETTVARSIRVLCEVEKVWTVYDLDDNGSLDYEEIVLYLKEMAFPHLDLCDEMIEIIFDKLDTDGDGTITKHEMESFIAEVLDA